MCSLLSHHQQQPLKWSHYEPTDYQWAYQPHLKSRVASQPANTNSSHFNGNNVIKRTKKPNSDSYPTGANNQKSSRLDAKSTAYNKTKVSPSRRIKNLLKPLLSRVFKSNADKPKRNSYIASGDQNVCELDWLDNDMENRANENLEHVLIKELEHCSNDNAAIIVYDEKGDGHLEHIDPDDFYVPVHFARTNDGTFFWTSIQRETIEPFRIEWNFMDRWAQA